ncbi:hypothetical protein [Gilvimarinus japonicus]|jgi:hypothetical protein|uniref:Fis family transcriptional regulator n=1 Tax=Gilvimarinus japonicus TaxID=1796469 RepID=A0ABV7HNC8_9GAMM
MRKTDKKIDNHIRKALSDACETALNDFFGFVWLTHLVDYSAFPKSLRVVCVFDTNDNLKDFTEQNGRKKFDALIQKNLIAVGVAMDSGRIYYDTEESCNKANNGRWTERLAK